MTTYLLKKLRKISIKMYFVLFFFSSALVQFCLVAHTIYVWPSQKSKVVFCDVGQGDAILITQGFTQVLVDAGPTSSSVLQCLNNHLPWFDTKLDMLVATHPDFDHIGGAKAVMTRFSLTKLLLVPDAKDTDGFRAFHETVLRKREEGTELVFPVSGDIGLLTATMRYAVLTPDAETVFTQDMLDTSAVSVTNYSTLPNVYTTEMTETTLSDALALHSAKINNYNDRSISLLFTIEDVIVLLAADIEKDTERALQTNSMLTDVSILKVAHHGAKTSSTAPFLAKVTPEVAVVSSGKENTYGHPASEVLTRLEQITSQVWRTDMQGEIVAHIQNGEYQITSKKTGQNLGTKK